MKEIGSEFEYTEHIQNKGLIMPEVKDYIFTFSGRTAIEIVLINEPHIKRVLLPSYCCDSMIEPFRKKGVEVIFYSVDYQSGLHIELSNEKADAVLWCNYFGFHIEMPDFFEFTKNGGIVIEDITHSFYSSQQYNRQSHYLIASLRKWGALLSGGYCASKYKELQFKAERKPPLEFLQNKKKAMTMKAEYLVGKSVNKKEFLKMFCESNSWLALNYSGLLMDEISLKYIKGIDAQNECMIRRRNAMILYSGLKNNQHVEFLFKEDKMECPLFVPIIITKCKRNEIRKKLVENAIYCPIHWPKPNANCESNLYDLELSLICDQRYDERDMQRIVSVICNL